MNKKVKAPQGYHWMKAGSGYKLMKNPRGGYKAHKGSSLMASFKVQMVHSNAKKKESNMKHGKAGYGGKKSMKKKKKKMVRKKKK